MRSLLGRFHRPFARGTEEQLLMLNNLGDGSTLSLDFTTGVLDPRLTFTRLSGGTYVANDGYIYGMDFATSSSLAIGTGSKSVTLTATAGVDRRYLVGQTVYISNGANNMSGPVTAYNASTQVLTINATATTGSGSFTSWTVGNASARFDYDPTTLAPKGLLIEGSATNLLNWSESFATSGGTNNNWADTNITRNSTNNTDPANGTTALRVTASAGNGTIISTAAMGTSAQRTFSIWLRRVSGTGDIQYTLDNGSTYTTQAITSSWVRYTFAATTAAQRVGIRIVTNNDSIELWGAQLEAGSGASSYIPTGASTGSRAADNCTIGVDAGTATNFSSWWPLGQAAWTVLWTGDIVRATTSVQFLWLTRTSLGSSLMRVFANSTSGQPLIGFAGNTIPPASTVNGTPGALIRTALANQEGDQAFYANNGTVSSSGTATLTGIPTTSANMNFNPNGDQFMHIKTLKFWPTRLPNAQLQSLTT